jgi:putative tributyrin esterase
VHWEPGLQFVTLRSQALGGRRGDISLYVPDDAEKPSSLAIFLHGVNGSHWNWAFHGHAHRTAQRLIAEKQIAPIAIVMPSDGLWGDGTGYVPHADADYEAWIVDDVLRAARDAAGLDERTDVFITGLSMGGYGALRLGAKYASRFRAIAAHSSFTDYASIAKFVREPLSAYLLAGRADLDVFEQLSAHRDELPPLRFDCGIDDSLLAENRDLHVRLAAANIPHEYLEYPGGHEWSYWSARVEDTLRFFDRAKRKAKTGDLDLTP